METGQSIGRYRLLDKVGKGGMAEIFKAEESLPDGSKRIVAIKRLFPRLSADREFVGMFVNEARIASSMNHINIIRTYDLVNYGSYYYIVMEFVEGMDLEEIILQRGPGGLVMPIEEVAYVVHQVALGLAYAHSGGELSKEGPVIHRDISPGNILLGIDGRVKITDFGIARAKQYASFTRPGVLKGKYEYMSPEYVKGLDFDGRADLFSLGVVLYELLVGECPFSAVLPNEIWKKIVESEVVLPSKMVAAVPAEMDQVVINALAKDPNKRFSSGEEMAANLSPFFEQMGEENVKNILGQRVARMMHKGNGGGAESTTQHELDAFLPPEEEVKNQTQEIHLDEILQLIDPVEVPKPIIRPEKSVTPVKIVIPEEPASPRRINRWIIVALLSGLVAAGAIWWIWPKSMGILSVESDVRAEVYVDGKRWGLAPVKELRLSSGIHMIELRRPGRNQVKSYRKNIEEGKLTELVVKWKEKLSAPSLENKGTTKKPDKKPIKKSDKKTSSKEKRRKRKK